jgi:acyl-coenzyme A synthetase/AMP-(fatty) acid ligase
VWNAAFLVMDFWFIFYLFFLGFSLLGVLYSVKFFAFHVLDLAARIKTLNCTCVCWDQWECG